MALHLVTGYAGKSHITAADHGALNASIFGKNDYVVNTGNKFSAVSLTANSVQILDGEVILHGRQIRMEAGDSDEVTITSGTADQKRNDLICIRYTKNSENGIEEASFVVITGTPDASEPADPEYNNGSILDGTMTVDFPLYRVPLDGLNVGELEALFEVKESLADRMAETEQIAKDNAEEIRGMKGGGSTVAKATDADTVDGKHASDFLPAAGGTLNGELWFNDQAKISGTAQGMLLSLGAPNESSRQIYISSSKRRADIADAIELIDNENMQTHTVLHTGNSAKVVFTEDSTTAPEDTTALWAHL